MAGYLQVDPNNTRKQPWAPVLWIIEPVIPVNIHQRCKVKIGTDIGGEVDLSPLGFPLQPAKILSEHSNSGTTGTFAICCQAGET